MKILKQSNKNFFNDLKFFLDSRNDKSNLNIEKNVKNIISQVKKNGDKSLIKLTNKYDNFDINKKEILVPNKTKNKYKSLIDQNVIKSFKIAIQNIIEFHKKQLPQNYSIRKNNTKIGSFWRPIDSVGLYVPGGKAAYPSSLLMNVIPAKVAGVKRIVVTTPSTNGQINPYIYALLDLLNINEVYQLGGAQAIAALAYGTESIKSVDKIFGPGNAFVSNAKKQLFGKVGIDLIAGPSEILVVANNDNNPYWVASDLIAQAEHDDRAQSILLTDSTIFAKKILFAIEKLSANLTRKNIIKKSIKNFGAIIILKDFVNSHNIINIIAPEHLHIHLKNYKKILKKITNAGSIFIGPYTSEAFGDYIIGTNHILPTLGSARFSSGLGVLDFMKRSSFVHMNQKSYNKYADKVVDLASIEGLDGHKLSVKIRQSKKKLI